MDQMIKGYRLLAPFTTAGAGSARWTFAEKNGEEYFLKEFLAPVYPSEDIAMPESVRKSRIEQCRAYERRKGALYQQLRRLDNGNIVAVHEFFRSDTKYYIATQRIREASITAEQAHSLPMDKLAILIRSLVHSLMQLEKGGIVHADLKPSNIMLKPTRNGFYSLKLIDFDGSFFENEVPEDSEELQGDPVYLAPEMFLAMRGDDVKLTSKVDVFALGIMLHEFLSGKLPGMEDGYDYVFESVLDGAPLSISSEIPDVYRGLIDVMLQAQPEKRPTFAELFAHLTAQSVPAAEPRAESFAHRSEPAPKSKPASGVKNPWLKPAEPF